VETRVLSSATGPAHPRAISEEPLRFFVIETGAKETMAAIRTARTLARGLNAQMTLLAAVQVPLPLPLQEPPISIAFLEDRLRELVMDSDVPGRVELRLCRERRQAIREALPARAIVVMAGRTGWFHRAARRFAAALTRDGHKVFFVEESRHS
jgi:hypothetical protein